MKNDRLSLKRILEEDPSLKQEIGWKDITEDEDIERVRTVKAWTPAKAPERESCEDWHDIPSGEMTLEQARQAVRELRKYVMDNHILSKSENTVSRQAVLDIDFHKLIHTTTKPAEIIRQKIKDLPPVTPQPKTGYWIDTGSGQMCSRCGEIQYGYDSFRRFCASCGAKMIDQQEMQLCRKEN